MSMIDDPSCAGCGLAAERSPERHNIGLQGGWLCDPCWAVLTAQTKFQAQMVDETPRNKAIAELAFLAGWNAALTWWLDRMKRAKSPVIQVE